MRWQWCLLLLSIFVILAACSKPAVVLPNGYRIAEKSHNLTFLLNPEGEKIIDFPINEFAVSGQHIYGWVNDGGGKNGFFCLDTTTGQFQTFEHWKQLDKVTDRLGLPRLTMNNSFSYLDIATGYKQAGWTNGSRTTNNAK